MFFFQKDKKPACFFAGWNVCYAIIQKNECFTPATRSFCHVLPHESHPSGGRGRRHALHRGIHGVRADRSLQAERIHEPRRGVAGQQRRAHQRARRLHAEGRRHVLLVRRTPDARPEDRRARVQLEGPLQLERRGAGVRFRHHADAAGAGRTARIRRIRRIRQHRAAEGGLQRENEEIRAVVPPGIRRQLQLRVRRMRHRRHAHRAVQAPLQRTHRAGHLAD